MTLVNTIDVGGTVFGLLNSTIMGVCNTPAGSEVKACTFADNFELKAGVTVTIKFTYANTYGDGSTTYPKLSVNGASYPIKYATNAYAGAGAWINGQTVPFMFDGTGFILVANLMQTSVISSANTTVNGAPLYNGANVKVMFTAALTGVDTSTALVLNYNGSNITVKVPVNGALVDYTAKAVDESGTTAYYFCQAYTTFELLFDGTYFVITNNPVVISNSDYVVNADGSITYTKKGFQKITVARYNSDDNVNILLRACAEFGIGGQTWVTIRVTCVSYTNGSVWYQYILRFYYVSATTTFQQLFKIGGVSDITDWNDYGTIISNMDDQNPHYCIELLETV